jgi:hypothetical protein
MFGASLYHLVGGRQHRFRDGKAERLGGFEVDDHLVLGRRLQRQIGGREDAADIDTAHGPPTAGYSRKV